MYLPSGCINLLAALCGLGLCPTTDNRIKSDEPFLCQYYTRILLIRQLEFLTSSYLADRFLYVTDTKV